MSGIPIIHGRALGQAFLVPPVQTALAPHWEIGQGQALGAARKAEIERAKFFYENARRSANLIEAFGEAKAKIAVDQARSAVERAHRAIPG